MTKRSTIIFDMDGLMVDSEPLSHRAWNQLLRPFGHRLTDEVIRQIIGHRADVSAQIVRDLFDLPLSVSEVISRRVTIYTEIRAQGVPPRPGLFALQARIADRHIPWAVATSFSADYSTISLCNYFANRYGL